MTKYGTLAQKKVKRAMTEMKEGKLKSGRSGKKVTNPKQAIAIGLSEAREEGGKVPKKPAAKKTATGKPVAKRTAATSLKKTAVKKNSSSRSRRSVM